MCASIANIHPATAEIRGGKKERRRRKRRNHRMKLECGPMPNVMVALPNIGGALSSTPQSLASENSLNEAMDCATTLPAESFYIMKLCSRLFVLYCRNCPKDDKFR